MIPGRNGILPLLPFLYNKKIMRRSIMARGYSMDLTKGSVFKKFLFFSFPLLVTNLLQQFYHSADVIVVGKFAQNSTVALAAVGSTGQITALLLNLFVGLSVGANVVCAQRRGAGDRNGVYRVIGTSLLTSLVSGVFLAVVGFLLSKPLLTLMGSPQSVIEDATVYMQIIFLSKPASLIFNFGAAILRAHGDTKRPMYILTSTGIINVVLNLLFVIVFHLDSAGVALATTIASYVSAALVLFILFRESGEYNVSLSDVKFYKEEFAAIAKVGIPTGINSILFNISNVIVASTLNSLGEISVAAVSAATSLSNIVHTFGSSFTSAAVSFSGQNYGARRLDRIDRLLWQGSLLVLSLLLIANIVVTVFPTFFMGLFTSDVKVIQAGIPKLLLTTWGYMLYVIASMCNSCQRGFGKSIIPTIIDVGCICVVRLIWVLAVFPFLEQTIANLYIAYPISWTCCLIGQSINFYFVRKREWKKLTEEKKEEAFSMA